MSVDHTGAMPHRCGRLRSGEWIDVATTFNTVIGPYRLRLVLGTALALFAAFLYAFNYTSFF